MDPPKSPILINAWEGFPHNHYHGSKNDQRGTQRTVIRWTKYTNLMVAGARFLTHRCHNVPVQTISYLAVPSRVSAAAAYLLLLPGRGCRSRDYKPVAACGFQNQNQTQTQTQTLHNNSSWSSDFTALLHLWTWNHRKPNTQAGSDNGDTRGPVLAPAITPPSPGLFPPKDSARHLGSATNGLSATKVLLKAILLTAQPTDPAYSVRQAP